MLGWDTKQCTKKSRLDLFKLGIFDNIVVRVASTFIRVFCFDEWYLETKHFFYKLSRKI